MGQVSAEPRTPEGREEAAATCADFGRVAEAPCPRCGGKGWRSLTVKLECELAAAVTRSPSESLPWRSNASTGLAASVAVSIGRFAFWATDSRSRIPPAKTKSLRPLRLLPRRPCKLVGKSPWN